MIATSLKQEQQRAILNKLANVGASISAIRSIYVYGSFLYASRSYKDIDLLVVIKNCSEPIVTIQWIDETLRGCFHNDGVLDINYVFNSELQQSINSDKSPFYYLYVTMTGELVFGDSIVGEFNYATRDHYSHVIRLSHRARQFYFNKREMRFWGYKFKKWAFYALAEQYYIQHRNIDADLKKTVKRLIQEYPIYSAARILFKPNIKIINPIIYLQLLETLRLQIETTMGRNSSSEKEKQRDYED